MSQLKVKLPQKALPMRRSSGEFWLRAQACIREIKNSRDNQTCCSRFVSVIAKPMASKKLAKKVYKVRFTLGNLIRTLGHNLTSYQKVIKKGSKHKGLVRNGLKDVQVRSRILFS